MTFICCFLQNVIVLRRICWPYLVDSCKSWGVVPNLFASLPILVFIVIKCFYSGCLRRRVFHQLVLRIYTAILFSIPTFDTICFYIGSTISLIIRITEVTGNTFRSTFKWLAVWSEKPNNITFVISKIAVIIVITLKAKNRILNSPFCNERIILKFGYDLPRTC
jgi:hypothetical protein